MTHLTSCLALLVLLSTDPLLLCPLCPTFLLHMLHVHVIYVHYTILIWDSSPGKNNIILTTLTILSFRAISSSSSFFLHSKWASIRPCSSMRSLFWRFFWMSCLHTQVWNHTVLNTYSTSLYRRHYNVTPTMGFAYIKVHFLSIRDFRSSWSEESKIIKVYEPQRLLSKT